jgi:hypothetical protein
VKTALALLPAEVSSRATVVGISPGFGGGEFSALPTEAAVVSGLGHQNTLVDATGIANLIAAGPDYGTSCGHDANCLFTQSSQYLLAFASPACKLPAETFSRSSKAPGEAGAAASLGATYLLFGGSSPVLLLTS